MARAPWLTLALVFAAGVVSFTDGLPEVLEFRRSAVSGGEFWRVITGQFVHWTWRMAVVDLGAVLVLGGWLELHSRRLFVLISAGALVLVGVGLGLVTNLETYRGVSGWASALFVAVTLVLYRHGTHPLQRGAALALLVAFLAKIGVEMATGAALAAGPLPPGISVTPVVHLLGGAAGLLALRFR